MIVIVFLILCLATCLFEAFALLLMEKPREWFKPVLLCNVLTNPILNMILPAVYAFTYVFDMRTGGVASFLILLVLELGVVFLEAWMLGVFIDAPFRKRLKVSFGLNAFSFVWGLILTPALSTLLSI